MSALLCDFTISGLYETELHPDVCLAKFAKYGYVINSKPWHGVDGSKILQPLTRKLLFYGVNKKCMDRNQWNLSNNSVSYKISTLNF